MFPRTASREVLGREMGSDVETWVGVVRMCLVAAPTVVSVGEGSSLPASAAGSASLNLVVNGNFGIPPVGTVFNDAQGQTPQTASQTTGFGATVTTPAVCGAASRCERLCISCSSPALGHIRGH